MIVHYYSIMAGDYQSVPLRAAGVCTGRFLYCPHESCIPVIRLRIQAMKGHTGTGTNKYM